MKNGQGSNGEQELRAQNQAKRDRLQKEFGMQSSDVDSALPPEVEGEWLDHIYAFEQALAEAKQVTVRERIGDPPLQPAAEILPEDAAGEVEALLSLLFAHGIAVDFLGTHTPLERYHYLVDELLDEEMDDIRLEGLFVHFVHSTPEYDVEMWAELFIHDLVRPMVPDTLPGGGVTPLRNLKGEEVTVAGWKKTEGALSELLKEVRFDFKPVATSVDGNQATVTAIISWCEPAVPSNGQVESVFRLEANRYEGWDVVQTSFLDDLVSCLSP